MTDKTQKLVNKLKKLTGLQQEEVIHLALLNLIYYKDLFFVRSPFTKEYVYCGDNYIVFDSKGNKLTKKPKRHDVFNLIKKIVQKRKWYDGLYTPHVARYVKKLALNNQISYEKAALILIALNYKKVQNEIWIKPDLVDMRPVKERVSKRPKKKRV